MIKTVSESLLNEMLEGGYVHINKHPTQDLFIYNYTNLTQYHKMWNEVTLNSRGLIVDSDNNIVARPFKKFFNLSEYQPEQIPSEPFEVYEKMDGSLGILFCYKGKFQIATRGSFNSEQAIKANKILNIKYGHILKCLDKSHTYLVEIIYPENRIVVDYGTTEDLILLAVYDTKSGDELPLCDVGLPIVKKYDGINSLEQVTQLHEDNREGFVLRFKSGFRVKVKFEEYIRIHRIVTHVSTTSIWEILKKNQPIEHILDRVPDEFYKWVKTFVEQLHQNYEKVKQEALNEFKTFETRKDAAVYYQTCKHKNIMYKMMDKKDYSAIIWKQIKPKFSKPFTIED